MLNPSGDMGLLYRSRHELIGAWWNVPVAAARRLPRAARRSMRRERAPPWPRKPGIPT